MANVLGAVSKQYNQLYNPLIKTKKTQLGNLAGSFAPQRAALDQAKKNAFRTFDANAAERNVFYSGYAPEKQAEYIGQTYTPELAKIGTAEQTQRLGLIEELNKILIQRGQDIFGRTETIQDRLSRERISKSQMGQQRRISAAEIAAMLQKANI